jgi:hypothetical protein
MSYPSEIDMYLNLEKRSLGLHLSYLRVKGKITAATKCHVIKVGIKLHAFSDLSITCRRVATFMFRPRLQSGKIIPVFNGKRTRNVCQGE